MTVTRQDGPGARSVPVRPNDQAERIVAVLKHFSQHRSVREPRDAPPEEAASR